MFTRIILSASLCFVSLGTLPAAAQSQPAADTQQAYPNNSTRRRVIRNAELKSFWVEAPLLSVRDNPFAGSVVAMLNMGQKVKAYQAEENWIRISPDNKAEKWVNSDFLTQEKSTWANYSMSTRSMQRRKKTPVDIDLERLDINMKNAPTVFVASLKAHAPLTRVIVTRHDFDAGSHYERRMIQCNSERQATHSKMLGEGYSYSMMSMDSRNAQIDRPMEASHALGEDAANPVNTSIASYACNPNQ